MVGRIVLHKYLEVVQCLTHYKSDVIAFDTETTSLKYYDLEAEGMSLYNGDTIIYIDFISNPDKDRIIEYLKDWFKEVDVLAAHNLVFDLKVLHKLGIQIPESTNLYCSMVADHLIDENREHGLKYLAEKFLDADTTKYTDIKDHKSEKFYEYAQNDALWVWDLMQLQIPQLDKQNLTKLFQEIEMPFQRVLLDMEVAGVKVDLEKVESTRKEIYEELTSLKIEMCDIVNIPYTIQTSLDPSAPVGIETEFNFNSSAQLSKLLFEDLGLEVVDKTPTGKPSVGAKTIETLKDMHPFVNLLYKYKIASKLLSAFFNPLPQYVDDDGRVRPNFRDVGTKTGRLSCQKPNLQQLPRLKKELPIDTRACFVVEDGYKMIACDYSGQELRVLTEITQEPSLIETFNKGKDLHLSTARDFFGLPIPPEALFKTHKDFDKYKDRYKDERQKAKIINFGIAYGKGAYGFSKDFNITEEEAQKILDKYFGALPRVKKAIEETHKAVASKGYVESLTGRRRRFKSVTTSWGKEFYPKGAYRQSFNFLIQGFSADMMRMALIATRKLALKHPEWDLKTIATVHDEGIFEVKEQYASEVAEEIRIAFENVIKFSIPIVADVDVGNTYSDVK